MYEIIQDNFWKILADYPECVVEYSLIKSEEPYCGEISHRKVLSFAMERFSKVEIGEGPIWNFNMDSAVAEKTETEVFFFLPEVMQHSSCTKKDGDVIPYWYAFLMPPHKSSYAKSDFIRINEALFPRGKKSVEIYEWSTDWSDYFADGREWWGTMCATIYDTVLERFIVIMSSATD